ncbi:NAD+ synthase [Herbaspirillum sp. RTI4]|uniref:NAD+ synthase n=1 Tax=Herbaspirillum sp. RTI4 TaxID=3048640 RepID=UPI002AB54B79|nr:NAD+ synthase [Herbaspirillum sp. RTI4]MDY7580096.1 NAD+ synthase [Herbaspirillum sp. RTI4]MEA9983123.1 NAD+ synthase [Herbaspirillum sp. RTI4]
MSVSIALIQAAFTVGNIDANLARIAALYQVAVIAKADLVVFSEMNVTGYPPEDLILNAAFQQSAMQALEQCARMTSGGPAMLIGSLWCEEEIVFNAIFLLQDGRVAARQEKHHLPNDGVFDERRYFTPGAMPEPLLWRGMKLGLLVCEDMWFADVSAHLKHAGAELLIAMNASPFETGKPDARERAAISRVQETGLALLYVNQIGGQDELVFDGGSFVLGRQADICARLHVFREDMEFVRLQNEGAGWSPLAGTVQPRLGDTEMIYRAMMLGLRDFVLRNGFAGVVIGMSGGIDSALAAALASDALGAAHVRSVMMPSPITSDDSVEDATDCAQRLGIRIDTVPIDLGMQAFGAMLETVFDGPVSDLAFGDNQTRLRAGILLAISSKENLLLLNTGNKSEMAVGYTTPYGDMCGHFAVLKDAYKTTVFALAAWRNLHGEVIPPRILSKPPSAELYEGQTDQDTLPPYALLDAVLHQLVECRLGVDEVAAQGFSLSLVRRVNELLHVAEYKRRQAPPGVKISSMSFGRDRRYPITNGWQVMERNRVRHPGAAE